MTILKDMLTKIESMVRPEITEVEDVVYYGDKELHTKSMDVSTIRVNTLTGLIDYLKADIDNFSDEMKLFIHVYNYDTVRIV